MTPSPSSPVPNPIGSWKAAMADYVSKGMSPPTIAPRSRCRSAGEAGRHGARKDGPLTLQASHTAAFPLVALLAHGSTNEEESSFPSWHTCCFIQPLERIYYRLLALINKESRRPFPTPPSSSYSTSTSSACPLGESAINLVLSNRILNLCMWSCGLNDRSCARAATSI